MSEGLHIYTGENDVIKIITNEKRTSLYTEMAFVIEEYFVSNWDIGDSIDYTKGYFPISAGVFINGVTLHNFFYKMGKRNILFVTNFDNSSISDGFSLSGLPGVSNPNATKANLGLFWTPIVSNLADNETSVKFTSSFQSGDTSLVKYIHGRFSVPSTNCNNKYELGMTDWTIETPSSKYDAVILSGIPNPSGEVHNIEDIKSVFAPYCTDDFILLDQFESEESRLEFVKQWPNFDADEVKRIGSERTQRIEGDKLDLVDTFRSINTYSLTSQSLDDGHTQYNRVSDILFEYFLDFYQC